jgi:hypothetical protein
MAIQDDFAISALKAITYVGNAHGAAGAGYYTTIEFHRWLQDIADDANPATANDLIDITSDTPSDRKTDNYIQLINGYNIDDTVSEHIFDGSIEQLAGFEIYDGFAVIANAGMDLQLVQDGAQIANDFWNTVPNGETTKGLNRSTTTGLSHRFLLKVRTANADIDGRKVLGMTRVDFTTRPSGIYGKTFSEFNVNGTARGNNVMALTYADDLNDNADASGLVSITNTEGYRAIDVNANGADEFYYSEWNRAALSINKLYQRIKYLSRADVGNSDLLYGIDAKIFRGITHEIAITGIGGVWVEPEAVSWSGGTGQLLATDNTAGGSTTKIWIQLLTGIAPTSGTVTGAGGATGTATGNTGRVVSPVFAGVSTGSALIGAYGFGVEALDLGPNDTVFDLDANPFSAPNNVTFSISGVVNAEDRILVGPSTGATALQYDQFALNAGITSGATSLVVKLGLETPGTGTDSATDTPNSGTIRVQDDTGVYVRVTYTGYTVGAGIMTFTGLSNAPTAASDNEVFISYIDSLYGGTTATDRFVSTYSGVDRSLYIRVRDGGTAGDVEGIKTFETQSALASSSASVTAIRTPDV